MKKLLRAIAALAIVPVTLACSCAEGRDLYKEYFSMGTIGSLSVAEGKGVSRSDFASLSEDIGDLLRTADNSLGAYLSTSYIYAFNAAPAGSSVKIDKTTYDVLSAAVTLYEYTEGYYNPAVYHSVQAYGFPLTGNPPASLPSNEKAHALSTLAAHFNELELKEENGAYYAVKPEFTVTVEGVEYSLALDLGGIGKGWFSDRISALFDSYGVKYGVFNFGSSMTVRRYAHNSSGAYSLQPRDPRVPRNQNAYFCSMEIKDCNLSTGSDSEQYYVLDGVRYSHTINPFTGSPIQTGIASVTIVGGSATEDDALTTALACMGKEKAVEFINEKLSDRIVIMLVFEGEAGGIITNRPDLIKLNGNKYAVINTVQNGRIVL